MLTRIIYNSPALCSFLEPLSQSLSQPQRQHLRDLCDGLLVCETTHTIAAMQRLFVETTDPSNWADFLRISPWDAERVRADLLKSQIEWALEEARKKGPSLQVYLNLDDSIGDKDPHTWRLDVVDWHHDHNSPPKQPRYQKGYCYLACTMCIGEITVTLDVRLYLRTKTVKAINRKRSPANRVRFRSKNSLVREMLTRIEPHLPPDGEVIVQFDSWYAAQRTLKFIHRRKWKITCGVKSNRKLDGVRLDAWHGKEKHKWYHRITVTNTQKEERHYYVRPVEGRLEKVPFNLRVLISKQHKGQKSPAYFASTRLCSSPTAILQGYTRRWSCESLNFYLKVDLGLSDFRLWHYEAVDKYVVAVHLAWAYIERRFVKEQDAEIRCPGDLLRRHREEHAAVWLEAAVRMALDGASLDQVLQRFLRHAPVVE